MSMNQSFSRLAVCAKCIYINRNQSRGLKELIHFLGKCDIFQLGLMGFIWWASIFK